MGTIVDTRGGKVEGVDAGGIHIFKGIPFATPPVGRLRWRRPVPEAAWDGVRDASEYGPYIAQGDMMLDQMMGSAAVEKDEDGLTLNVFTPSLDGKRPVMVWIHGGAFQFGSGSTPWYDGTRFAANGDVVVVTINYRLGPLGYLYLADLHGADFDASGNLGTCDQIAALEWVRDCIANFGGDADDVTIFGESAGGGSVGTLLGTPSARGLFHKSILQSGAASWGLTRAQATDKARRVIEALGVSVDDLEGLYAKSAEELVAASAILGLEADGDSLPFAPVHDGVVLPQPPLDAIRAGNAKDVAVLCGTNLDEMTLFDLMEPALATMDDAALVARVRGRVDGDAEALVAAYRAARPLVSNADLWTVIAGDALFRIPAIQLVEAQLAHSTAYMYLFTWPSPAWGGALKSCHALEIAFAFDNLDQPGITMFTGDGPERDGIAKPMHAAWTAFAHTGDPNHQSIPQWPAYSLERRATMQIDVAWALLEDPYGEEREFWAGTS